MPAQSAHLASGPHPRGGRNFGGAQRIPWSAHGSGRSPARDGATLAQDEKDASAACGLLPVGLMQAPRPSDQWARCCPCQGAHAQIRWQVPSGYSGAIGLWGGDFGALWDAGAGQLISRSCFWAVRRVQAATIQVVWLDPAAVPVRSTRAIPGHECPNTKYKLPERSRLQGNGSISALRESTIILLYFVVRCTRKSAASTGTTIFPPNSHLKIIPRSPLCYPPHSHQHHVSESLLVAIIRCDRALELWPLAGSPHRLLAPVRSAPLSQIGRRWLVHERSIRLRRKRASHLTSPHRPGEWGARRGKASVGASFSASVGTPDQSAEKGAFRRIGRVVPSDIDLASPTRGASVLVPRTAAGGPATPNACAPCRGAVR